MNEILNMRYYNQNNVVGLQDLMSNLPNEISMIEIGSYSGESTEIFLNTGKIKELTCIDPWQEGYDDNDGASFTNMAMVERMFDDRILYDFPYVTKIKNQSYKECNNFDDGSVDFVYIDGNHTYKYVKDDIKNYLPKVKTGGYFGGHDYTNINHSDVRKAVDEVFGEHIDIMTFKDSSWLIKVIK